MPLLFPVVLTFLKFDDGNNRIYKVMNTIVWNIHVEWKYILNDVCIFGILNIFNIKHNSIRST